MPLDFGQRPNDWLIARVVTRLNSSRQLFGSIICCRRRARYTAAMLAYSLVLNLCAATPNFVGLVAQVVSVGPASQPASLPIDDEDDDAPDAALPEGPAPADTSAESEDEPVNDEAGELYRLKELEQDSGKDFALPPEAPALPLDDSDLVRQEVQTARRVPLEAISELLVSDPGALFGRGGLLGPLPSGEWPMFVEYAGSDGLYDPAAYDIPIEMHPMVETWLKFFTGRGREYFVRWLGRSTRYIPMFHTILKQHGLPLDTVYLSMIESGFYSQAFSRAKAAGPWQFMSYTGKRFGLKIDGWVDERRDWMKATHAAAEYLKELKGQFGHWHLAWAGYNAGGGKMSRAISKYDTKDFWELVIPKRRYLKPETKNYVPKLIAAAILAKSPKRFGFTDIEWQQPFDFEEINVEGPLDLKYVAQAAGCDYDYLRELNSALKHGITPPRSYPLRVPRGTKELVQAKLPELVPKTAVTYSTHQARRGESLATIAARYGSTADLIREQNRLGGVTRLKHGQELLIPLLPGKTPRPVEEEPVRVAKQPKAAASSPLASNGATSNAAVAAAVSGEASYVVQAGDSLWSIAQTHGVTVDDLKKWNRIRNHRGLQVGQTLKTKP